jgi:phenylpropionate dioxygenase-like ring-hydroxylating dioxygenase large terminal subunit
MSITIFARISKTYVVAMVDECPHKGASLSVGRVASSGTGNFQCAYHSWSIDVIGADRSKLGVVPLCNCGKGVLAMIHQGMLWLFPASEALIRIGLNLI